MRRKPFRLLLVFLLMCLLSLGSTQGVLGIVHTDGEGGAATADNLVIVRLAAPPVASYEGGINDIPATKPAEGERLDLTTTAAQDYLAYLKAQRDDFKAWLAANAPTAVVLREYAVVYNGVALQPNGTDLSLLSGAPNVTSVTQARLLRPAMNVSHELIGAPDLWRAAGGVKKAGAGIKVGVIDSGIDQNHVFLTDDSLSVPPGFPKGDTRFTSNKVIVAKVFHEDSTKTAEADNSHGTHVSGTIAGVYLKDGALTGLANPPLTGIAPKAWLGNYNVFPRGVDGATEASVMAAVEESVIDGMDVINLSLGGSALLDDDPMAEAVNSAVDAGVVAAVAAGNSGPGHFTVGTPAIAEKAITVAASTNPHFFGVPVAVTGPGTVPADLQSFPAATGEGGAEVTATIEAPYVDWDAIAVSLTGPGCEPTAGTPLEGKIALIKRGACFFSTKINNAHAAGAIAVIISNNVDGDPVGMGMQVPVSIPAVMVSKAVGARMVEWYAQNPGSATVRIEAAEKEFITDSQDILAGFSSWGPTPGYRLKPDLAAPGVNIYSSVVGGGYAAYQGTSMAAPHVAGAAAVLRQMYPNWSPNQVKSALANTAAPVHADFARTKQATVLQVGAGRIDLTAAAEPVANAHPALVGYGQVIQATGAELSANVVLTNPTKFDQTYELTVTTGNGYTVTLDRSSTTIAAGSRGGFTLSISVPPLLAEGDYQGVVTVTAGGKSIRIPYWFRVSAL